MFTGKGGYKASYEKADSVCFVDISSPGGGFRRGKESAMLISDQMLERLPQTSLGLPRSTPLCAVWQSQISLAKTLRAGHTEGRFYLLPFILLILIPAPFPPPLSLFCAGQFAVFVLFGGKVADFCRIIAPAVFVEEGKTWGRYLPKKSWELYNRYGTRCEGLTTEADSDGAHHAPRPAPVSARF